MLQSRCRGFNLIELMIVVAIVGIIAGVAYPSYQDSIRKSNRQVGKTALLEVLGRQEQYFVNMKSYATDLTNLNYPANGFYVDNEGDPMAGASGATYLIQLSSPTVTSYTVQAVPQGGQTNDTACGTLAITDSGAKTPTTAGCW